MNKSFFEFIRYDFSPDSGKALFTYRLGSPGGQEYEFTETLIFSDLPKGTIDQKLIDKALSAVHMALGISYYKLYCPTDLRVKTGGLSKAQAAFWNTVYTNGLMQFYFENKIDYRKLVAFPHIDKQTIDQTDVAFQDRALVALGGGKDSFFSYDLLKKSGITTALFDLGKFKLHESIAEVLKEKHIVVERQIDPMLFELNKQDDTYDGHVPITMINSFVSLLSATLYNYRYVIFSNEESSNYGNVEYLGEEVNHQWSKSAEFEKLFQEYIKSNITSGITIFSILRPLHEIEIVRRFTQKPQYFHIFSSCNRNFTLLQKSQTDKLWCCGCEKCAFVWTLLSAFISKKELISIFGENLYEKESLLQTFKDLLGIGTMKPFECVGTPEETIVAMCLASQNGEYKDTVIMKQFENNVLPTVKSIEDLKNQVFKYGDDSLIPERFRRILS